MQGNEPTASTHPSQQKGWLRPYLVMLDPMYSKRWDYWLKTLDAGKILDEPIPQIQWLWTPHQAAIKNLTTVLNLSHTSGHTVIEAFRLFVDWLLFGFGDPSVEQFPIGIDPPLNLYGMDIDPLILKVCRINMWWYVPWCVYRPKTLEGISWLGNPLSLGDALARHSITKITPQAQEQLETYVQLNLFDRKAALE